MHSTDPVDLHREAVESVAGVLTDQRNSHAPMLFLRVGAVRAGK
jgi:hypothetical protein